MSISSSCSSGQESFVPERWWTHSWGCDLKILPSLSSALSLDAVRDTVWHSWASEPLNARTHLFCPLRYGIESLSARTPKAWLWHLISSGPLCGPVNKWVLFTFTSGGWSLLLPWLFQEKKSSCSATCLPPSFLLFLPLSFLPSLPPSSYYTNILYSLFIRDLMCPCW